MREGDVDSIFSRRHPLGIRADAFLSVFGLKKDLHLTTAKYQHCLAIFYAFYIVRTVLACQLLPTSSCPSRPKPLFHCCIFSRVRMRLTITALCASMTTIAGIRSPVKPSHQEGLSEDLARYFDVSLGCDQYVYGLCKKVRHLTLECSNKGSVHSTARLSPTPVCSYTGLMIVRAFLGAAEGRSLIISSTQPLSIWLTTPLFVQAACCRELCVTSLPAQAISHLIGSSSLSFHPPGPLSLHELQTL